MIIFLHIAKTAGTYIRESIFRQNVNVLIMKELLNRYLTDGYLSDYLNGDKKIKLHPEGLVGHIPHGVHKIFDIDEDSVKYFTILRDPVQRWLSHFYYSQNDLYIRNPRNEYTRLYKQSGYSVDKFVRNCYEKNLNSNLMVRQISGAENIKLLEDLNIRPYNRNLAGGALKTFWNMMMDISGVIGRSIRWTHSLRPLKFQSKGIGTHKKKEGVSGIRNIMENLALNYRNRKNGRCDYTLSVYAPVWTASEKYSNEQYRIFLKEAKNNLKRYAFIGTGENIEKETERLCQVFGWKLPPKETIRRKTEYFRVKKQELSNETMGIIRELNKYDIELYDWCRVNFKD
jgi:hypothetical protein